ncbi:baseplate J/gp47 family protein [Streptomyces roseifaciens]
MTVDAGIVAQIDYTSRDFTGYRESLLQYASQILPEWTSRSPADFGIVLVELFSYMGDVTSFYQDRIQDESFLATATQRSSVVAIAQQLGYQPHSAIPATGWVAFSPAPGLVGPYTLPAGTQVITGYVASLDRPVVYETTQDAVVPPYATPLPQVTVPVVEGFTQGTRTLTLYPASAAEAAKTVKVEDIGVSTGLKSQVFALAQRPALLDTVRVFMDDGTGGTEWTRVRDFLLTKKSDQIFSAFTDDKGTSRILFGDGVNGAIPATGLKITAAYRTGGGAYGNIPPNNVRDLADGIPGIVVTGSSAMQGGADEEPLEQIRTNAPRVFRTQGRAVSAQDYADLALTVAGIEDAKAIARSASSVVIYVIGPNNLRPSQAQRDEVAAYVHARALSGVTVTVSTGTLVPVNVGSADLPTLVNVLPRFRRDTVKLAVEQSIQKVFAPPVTTFGSRISLSQVYRAIQDTPGVDWAIVQLMSRNDLPQDMTADVICRDYEIPVMGNLVVVASGGV